MAGAVRLRPVTPHDEAFLRSVYAGTREHELSFLPWTAEQKEAFVNFQFEAQKLDYSRRFPKGEHFIVLVADRPVGRFWVNRSSTEVRLLDIALLPEERGKGTGTVLLKRLQEEARQAGLPLRHSVHSLNVDALRLYERLGFEVLEDYDSHLLMEWSGSRPLEGSD